jgi:hypothetical protein
VKTLSYRQGVVNTNLHPTLLNGQIVYILEDNQDFYKVKVCNNSRVEIIEKKYILIN